MTAARRIRPAATPAPGTRQRGFTLLESLIALLVLAVGLLGLAALQVRGLAYNHDAYVRSQATILAYDLIERMRMRKLNGESGAAIATAMSSYVAAAQSDNAAQCNTGTAWQSADIATEVACWQRQLSAALPDGRVSNFVKSDNSGAADSADDDVFELTISWANRLPDAQREQGTGEPERTSQTWTFQL